MSLPTRAWVEEQVAEFYTCHIEAIRNSHKTGNNREYFEGLAERMESMSAIISYALDAAKLLDEALPNDTGEFLVIATPLRDALKSRQPWSDEA